MKKYLVSLISFSCLIILLIGCDSGPPGQTSVSGTVEIGQSNYTKPLSNAIVSINDKTTTTTERGTYKISDLREGVANVGVSDQGKRIYSKDTMLSPGDNIVNISVKPMATVLKYDTFKWQLAFYATPPFGKNITRGIITDPNWTTYEMEPHFVPQWHKWWNINEPLPGSYQYEIFLDDNSKEIFTIFIADEDFDITLPTLNDPINDSLISTTTPTFQYTLPVSTTAAFIRLEEKVEEGTPPKWKEHPWILVDDFSEYTINSGILHKGKEYRWALQSIHKTNPLSWTEAKTLYEYFSVAY